MTPSITYRIDSLIQALNDIVLPAVEADKSLAREQGQLVVAHLHLMKRQLAQADAFDRMELDAARSLGAQLLQQARDDATLAAASSSLQDALARSSTHQPDLQGAIRALNGAIEQHVRTVRQLAGRHSIDAMTAAVLAHGREQSRRNRIWFGGNGFDAEHDSLPGIDTLFAAGR